jgi:hypothetical protein
MTDTLSLVARARGLEPILATRRGFRDNLVQYIPTVPEIRADTVTDVLERFVADRNIPDRGRGILENCIVTTRFPID